MLFSCGVLFFVFCRCMVMFSLVWALCLEFVFRLFGLYCRLMVWYLLFVGYFCCCILGFCNVGFVIAIAFGSLWRSGFSWCGLGLDWRLSCFALGCDDIAC